MSIRENLRRTALDSAESGPIPHAIGRRRAGLVSLIALIYLTVSGGAYGIEDAVAAAGPRLTMLLCCVIPFTLSLPTALMAAELTALIPREGGFYFWVKEGLGPFAGFLEAYLTILFVIVDTALYPVLFASYLAFAMPLGNTGQALLAIGLIWVAGLLNLLGVRSVGRGSILFTLALLAPFVALVLFGFPQLFHWHLPPALHRSNGDLLGALGGGLIVVMWNFSGWENVSVVAGEIEHPGKNYQRAIAIALPLVVLGYLLPLAIVLPGAGDTSQWHPGSIAAAGGRIGGPMLRTAIAIGGAVSAFAMFTAAVLWVSRLPFVLAGEGYLPAQLATLWRDGEVPARSIVACCIAFTLLVPLGFMTLLVFDVFFYMLALILEMVAFIRLRTLRLDRDGLFVIGGGPWLLYSVALAPLMTWIATFGFAIAQPGGSRDFAIAIAMSLLGWPVYALLRSRYGGPIASQPQ